jgi:hypothetical protein
MSYSTLRKLIRDNPRPQAPPAAPGAPSKTVNPLPKREGFHHNPNPDISDLV